MYLAHVGSFVPASAATVGLADRLLTRIASQESLGAQQSAFCADLAQVGGRVRQLFRGVGWHVPVCLLAWRSGRRARQPTYPPFVSRRLTDHMWLAPNCAGGPHTEAASHPCPL